MADEERRAAAREEAYVAAEISYGDGRPKLAVMQDASETGVRLLTHTRLEPGDSVEVSIQIAAERRLEFSGEIKRVDPAEGGGPWRFCIGIELDQPSEELGREAATIREKQTRSS